MRTGRSSLLGDYTPRGFRPTLTISTGTTGVPSYLSGLWVTTDARVRCSRSSCTRMHARSILKHTPPKLLIHRLSIPYTPPPQAGREPLDTAHLVTLPALPLPTGEVIEHPFKNFGYQLYFQNPQSTMDIQANVCSSSISPLHVRSNTRCLPARQVPAPYISNTQIEQHFAYTNY